MTLNPRSQIRIVDWALLIAIVGLELAGFADPGNVVLAALFISASIITLAVIWKRTLFRNLMILAIVAVFIAALMAHNAYRFADEKDLNDRQSLPGSR